jgi:Secretion system C-terminal sorting domain
MPKLHITMKKSLLSIFAFSAISFANAQEFPYPFEVLNEPYADLVEPVSLSGNELWDDPEYQVPIGFDFQLFDSQISELYILPPGSQIVGSISQKTTELLFPYLSDIMNASIDEAVSPISYLLDGTEGSYIFKLEFKNVGFYSEFEAQGTFGNTTNFQVWLYQGSNVIEYRFGDNTIKSGNLIHFFGNGPLVGLGQQVALDGSSWAGFWTLAGDPSNPTVSAIPTGTQFFTAEQVLSGEPLSGTVYRFGTLPTSIEEEQTTASIELQVWPTLATTEIHFNAKEGEEYIIYNMLGKQVYQGIATSTIETVNVSNLAAGQYILKTETGKGLLVTGY